MRKFAAKFSRSVAANALGALGLFSLDVAAFQWNHIAGYAALGLALLAAGWAVDE